MSDPNVIQDGILAGEPVEVLDNHDGNCKDSVLVESPPNELGDWMSPPDTRSIVWLSRKANIFYQNGIVSGLFPLAVHMMWNVGGKEIAA